MLQRLAHATLSSEEWQDFSTTLLHLPWVALHTAGGRALLGTLRAAGLAQAATGSAASRGHALELATVADQWLHGEAATHRFVFFGATLLGKDGQPFQEWDVVRLDLTSERTWNVVVTGCAMSRSAQKDGEAREKLEFLRQRLQGRFQDLTRYRTLLATVATGLLEYDDAGRGFAPT